MTTGSRSSPSSCMRPRATASRSAGPRVTEAHVVPLPARSRCREEASPPPAGTGTSAPSGPARKVSGPRLETTRLALTASRTSRQWGQRRRGHTLEGRPQHVDRLGAQLVQRPVAVDALAQVDLGQTIGSELLGHVDQQAELDALAAGRAA